MFFTTLRSQRKSCHFTQDEVAFLLGGVCGTKVTRYERGTRTPPLETVLALEIIYGTSARDLFPDQYRTMQKQITKRARALLKTNRGSPYKRQHLKAIIT
ncbi:helix-turn-helix domain-containing protein [Kordiimonas pumila]|uniref:Helix-turn-helix domain-containing protein n=1 Tax=Kordiimonas pumila TaxID=2161677 RepID=A0ABV7D3E6_9PROT|nr:helix-turn-helix transcriptional regulator [Kordiimonas pumila]